MRGLRRKLFSVVRFLVFLMLIGCPESFEHSVGSAAPRIPPQCRLAVECVEGTECLAYVAVVIGSAVAAGVVLASIRSTLRAWVVRLAFQSLSVRPGSV